MATKRRNGELQSFLQRAAFVESDDCFIVSGFKTRPSADLPGSRRRVNASRYVWAFRFGDPGERFVLHTCDNKFCVNIRHLYLGNQQQNAADAFDRHRRDHVRYCRGSASWASKLSADQVLEIRRRLTTGESQTALSREYNVSQPAISAIARRQSWAHI